MSFQEYTALSTSDLCNKLKTSIYGLTQVEALNRLEKYGQNRIIQKEITSWHILLRQFKNPFVYLLFVSFIISFWLGEKIDAFMILFFVGVNTLLGFYQEYKSESAVKLLKRYLASRIKVTRDGIDVNVETNLLVPGDLINLEPGDIIPADVRFIDTANLTVNETILTGESQPVAKFSNPIKKAVRQIYEAENIGFSGTTVVGGKGKAIVFATGKDTIYSNIVELTSESEKESTFEKELLRFSKFTLVTVFSTLIFVIATSIAIKPNPSLIELSLFAIALSVSVVPEALPVVTTFSLSIGAISLAKKSVIVKRLSSIEDLGTIEVLCSDKTGTLTENRLTVTDVYSDDVKDCILKGNLASGDPILSRNAQNNAFDVALLEKLDKMGQKKRLDLFRKIDEIPFDPNRRRVTVFVSKEKEKLLVTRGSPEEILALSDLAETKKKELIEWTRKMGDEGKRVLAVAERKIKDLNNKTGKRLEIVDYEKNLKFIGLIAFSDPIKESSYIAISSAKKLGVNVKILTGDSLEVARSVAKRVGLITDSSSVITGAEFDCLTHEDKRKAVTNYHVFARVTPQQKYDIIKILQEKYSVGFLGEGINDAPALKVANVAIVVQGAADVAKEAADIVLLERDLKVILDGIEGGRKVFENTSKYITATMASNFGNFFAVAVITPFISFLPMLPLQILLVNLLSDFPMIMVATDSVDPDLLKIPTRYDLKRFIFSALSFGAVSTAFDFVLFNSFVGQGEMYLQTYWFIESILSELLFLFTIRTTKPFWKTVLPSKSLTYLTSATVILTLILPFTIVGRDIFGFTTPSLKGLLSVFTIVFFYLLANEVVKFFFRFFKFRAYSNEVAMEK